MSYINKNLMNGEKIIYQTNLIWTAYIIGFVVFILGLFLMKENEMLGSVIILVGLFFLGIAYLKIKFSEFGVTNKRILIKTGILNTHSIEIMLSKVEGIEIEQSIVEKMINSGSIVIKGTGSTNYSFTSLHNPFEFRNAINEQISNL